MNLTRKQVEEQFGIKVLERLDRDHRKQFPDYSTAQAEIAKLDLEDELAARKKEKTSTYVERYSGGSYGTFGLLRGGVRG